MWFARALSPVAVVLALLVGVAPLGCSDGEDADGAAGPAESIDGAADRTDGGDYETSSRSCARDEDCDPSTFCVLYRCEAGACLAAPTAANTALPPEAQDGGDCKKTVCDGAGGTLTIADDADAPASTDDCKQSACSGGVPTAANTADGTPCSNGAGKCSSGECKLPEGHACTTDTECQTGFCTDKVCCNSRCGGVCSSCALAGKVGVCSILPPNTEDPGTCEGTFACTGGPGECLLKLGQPCTNPAQCITNNCSGNPMKCQ